MTIECKRSFVEMTYDKPNYMRVLGHFIWWTALTTLHDWFDINCMQANPEKFQALAIGKKTFDKKPVFEINDVKISCDESVKLLRVEIDYLLKFDSHISSICRKAAQQINILKRLGKHLTKLNKLTIFHTFIVSNFNYCPLSWHFCTEHNTTKLEKLQERALRFVYDDYVSSYDDLLDRAKIPSLKLRRIKTMAIEAFKIVHGIAPPCLHDCLTLKENRYNFRYTNFCRCHKSGQPHTVRSHLNTQQQSYGTISRKNLKLEPQGALIAHLSTMSTSVIS